MAARPSLRFGLKAIVDKDIPDMNSLPVLLLSALSIVWLLLEFQRRRWPRVVVGSVVVAMQLLFGMIVLDAIGRHIHMVESQQYFMSNAVKEMESGNQELVLRAMKRMNDSS